MVVLVGFGAHLGVLALAGGRQLRRAARTATAAGRVREDAPRTMPPDPKDWPHVTVQIPLYNEQLVAERIIGATCRLDYPADRLHVQVLDDSTDETTAIVAQCTAGWAAQGVHIDHVQRPHREGYKAGALAHGLAQSTAEFVAILDADFVPDPNFLVRLLPLFDDGIGLVQARWGHLNEDESVLTRVQAFGLDAHFNVEQRMRQALGCFINFNGTAGIWRRAAIEEAGGWESDTLTEDLDLSYRAQLCGWRLRYDPYTAVPAELPVSVNAFRTQQHRWTKGGVQTAVKTLSRLWSSDMPLPTRLEGTMHLTANMVFPFILLAALLHGPLLWLSASGLGPGPAYFGVLSTGLIGFAGFFLAHGMSQRAIHTDWMRRLVLFPVFLAGSVGISLSNSLGVWEVIRGQKTPFNRTPKFSGGTRAPAAWWTLPYATLRVPRVVWAELALGVWSLFWLVELILLRQWMGVGFQFLFASGFLFVAVYNLAQTFIPSRHDPR